MRGIIQSVAICLLDSPMPRQSVVRLLVVACALASCGASFAQRGYSTRSASRYAQQEQLQAQKAQQLLQAQEQLSQQEAAAISEATEQVAAAKRAHRQAAKDLTAAREKAQRGIEDSLGMKRLQANLTAAQADSKKLSAPVLEKLKASDEYTAAQKKAAAAKLAVQQVHSDTSISDADKKARLGELFNDSMGATNLEQLTLRKDQAVSDAHERVEAAQAKVAEARKKAIEKLNKDASVAAAQQAVEAALAQVKSAEANLASVHGQAESAEQQLAAGVLPPKTKPTGNGQGTNNAAKKN